ncbi:MAG: hypothetical protein CMA59_03585 [Euryarchaeota archaeon]|jgi:hypothetical protein|nr:hypothetical protein [Euryarchaeota archaeon]
MPKPKKAARGKHRWIGFRIENTPSRLELEDLLKSHLGDSEWRLFDINESGEKTLAIIKIPLKNFKQTIVQINDSKDMVTITSSGKIRLVRRRLKSTLGEDPFDTA